MVILYCITVDMRTSVKTLFNESDVWDIIPQLTIYTNKRDMFGKSVLYLKTNTIDNLSHSFIFKMFFFLSMQFGNTFITHA